jgi:membrane-associated phospholipid phosphatase
MEQMATEYRAVVSHGRLNGFGYFVAPPSLHALVAVFVLGAVRRAPLLFWFLLPITSLLVGSTFLLGYHYLLDVAIAVPLGCLFVPPKR